MPKAKKLLAELEKIRTVALKSIRSMIKKETKFDFYHSNDQPYLNFYNKGSGALVEIIGERVYGKDNDGNIHVEKLNIFTTDELVKILECIECIKKD